jgi:O-antigen ligase
MWTFCSTAIYLAIGISTELVLGTFQPFAPGYRFAGTLHPNVQGINCALLVLSAVAAGDIERNRRALFRACASLGLVFLILTASRTSFAAALLALSVYFMAVSSMATKIAVVCVLSIALSFLALVHGNVLYPDIESVVLLGRSGAESRTFDGRTAVWNDCANYVIKRPVAGYGFGGFWDVQHIDNISDATNWAVGGAHSAYLDCLLQVGAVGLAAYVFALLAGILRALRLYRLLPSSDIAFSGLVLLFCVLDSIFESNVMTPTFLMFLCMVVLTRLALECLPDAREESTIHARSAHPE